MPSSNDPGGWQRQIGGSFTWKTKACKEAGGPTETLPVQVMDLVLLTLSFWSTLFGKEYLYLCLHLIMIKWGALLCYPWYKLIKSAGEEEVSKAGMHPTIFLQDINQCIHTGCTTRLFPSIFTCWFCAAMPVPGAELFCGYLSVLLVIYLQIISVCFKFSVSASPFGKCLVPQMSHFW